MDRPDLPEGTRMGIMRHCSGWWIDLGKNCCGVRDVNGLGGLRVWISSRSALMTGMAAVMWAARHVLARAFDSPSPVLLRKTVLSPWGRGEGPRFSVCPAEHGEAPRFPLSPPGRGQSCEARHVRESHTPRQIFVIPHSAAMPAIMRKAAQIPVRDRLPRAGEGCLITACA